MKKLITLMDSFRLSVSIPSGLLVYVSYNIIKTPFPWRQLFFTILLCATTMLQNDLIDREHDCKKGKDFVKKNLRLVYTVLIFLWLALLAFIPLSFKNYSLPLVLTILCFMYSYARFVLGLSWILVGLVSASPTLFPLAEKLGTTDNTLFFICVLLFILGRELLKDIEDGTIDKGYKRTVISESIITPNNGQIIAKILIAISCFVSLLLLISMKSHVSVIAYIIYWVSISILMVSIAKTESVKKWSDVGMMLFLISLTLPL